MCKIPLWIYTCEAQCTIYIKHSNNTQPNNALHISLYPSPSPAATHTHTHNLTTPRFPISPSLSILQQSSVDQWRCWQPRKEKTNIDRNMPPLPHPHLPVREQVIGMLLCDTVQQAGELLLENKWFECFCEMFWLNRWWTACGLVENKWFECSCVMWFNRWVNSC